MEKEICICAAVRTLDDRIIRCHRHSDGLRKIFDNAYLGWKRLHTKNGQGFVTSTNRYVNRKEGAELQNAAGILSIRTGKPIDTLLTSEDLY